MIIDRKPIFDAVRVIRDGKSFDLADVKTLDAGIDKALATIAGKIDEARLADTIRGLWGPISQGQWDAIKAVLDGREVPAATPDGVTEIGLTQADFRIAANKLGCTVAQIRAVDEVESGGGWFTDVRADILNLDGPGGFIDGPNLPKILFEAHIFDKETGGRFRASHPNLSSAKWNRALYVGGQGEWGRLHRAMLLDRRAALMSASVGRYQIMGFNYRATGFLTVEAFWDAMMTSEAEQLQAFVAFIRASNLTNELRAISGNAETCRAFAAGYNGQAYSKNSYHSKIAAAFRKWSAD